MADEDEDGGGFDAEDWTRLRPFVGAVATLDDVQARRAVFALGDTDDPRAIAMDLPQPVIWWDDTGEQAAVVVQAESALARIRQEVSSINSMNAQIANASEQQSQAAEEVSQNISRIHLATRQTATGSQQVAAAVDSWAAHFRQWGVCPADMEQLAASIDRDALRLQRREYL